MKNLLTIWLALGMAAGLATDSFSQQYTLQNFYPLTGQFLAPLELGETNDGTNRILVADKVGIIWVLQHERLALDKKMFLDIQSRVLNQAESGLIGMAIHPDFANNGYVYVFYTQASPHSSIVSRFTVSSNPDSLDPSSELVLFDIPQNSVFHNGGNLLFGPNDGYLYLSTGDDISSLTSQDSTSLKGKILRVDVDSTEAGKNYAIPPDNPLAGLGAPYAEEIWAFGLRNPYEFSIDPLSNWMWAGDVGNDCREEVDIIIPGKNYGWPYMEGDVCYYPGPACSTVCDTMGRDFVRPLIVYPHNFPSPAAVIGGIVYRGSLHPGLWGWYLYADFSMGKIWAVKYNGITPLVQELIFDNPAMAQITCFYEDTDGEIMVTRTSGRVYKLVESPTGARDPTPTVARLFQNHPNPFNPTTSIPYEVSETAHVQIRIYDVAGSWIATLVDRTVSPGIRRAAWEGNDAAGNAVASGIYFYSLIVDGERVQTKRMALLK